jgi:hypothetical protein
MQNFEDFERKSYQPAVKKKYKRADFIAYYMRLLKFSFRVLLMSLREHLVNFFSVKKLKDIGGQLALVTGERNL